MDLTKFLNNSDIPIEIIQELTDRFTPLNIKKGGFFIHHKEKMNKIGILIDGILVSRYISEKGDKVASKFYFSDGDFIVADYNCFIKQLDSDEEIQAIEESRLLTISYEDFNSLIENHQYFLKLVYEYAESGYLKALGRIRDLQILDKEQIIRKFLKTHKTIFDKLPVKDKASYLGMHRNIFTKKLKEI